MKFHIKLPTSLTSLDINSYEGPLAAITESKSFKTLYLGGSDREIIVGQLPQSITSLALRTTLPVVPNLFLLV